MKHNYLMLLLIASMVSLSLVACEKDPNNNNSDNNQSENGKPVVEMINDAVTDIDGNHYNAVKIGKQVWMSENLKTKHYADGTEIPVAVHVVGNIGYRQASATNPYLYVENSSYLYNWSAVMHGSNSSNANPSGIQGVCPDGWHVPSWAEWQELKDYVSSYTQFQYDSCETCIGKSLAANSGWKEIHDDFYPGSVGYEQGSNNATGFSANPEGLMRTFIPYDTVVVHIGKNEFACFSSATKNNAEFMIAWLSGYGNGFRIQSSDSFWYDGDHIIDEISGLSVRCVRN